MPSNWTDQRTREAFEWAARKLKVSPSNLKALLVSKILGGKEFVTRVNPGDAFPPDSQGKEASAIVSLGVLPQI